MEYLTTSAPLSDKQPSSTDEMLSEGQLRGNRVMRKGGGTDFKREFGGKRREEHYIHEFVCEFSGREGLLTQG